MNFFFIMIAQKIEFRRVWKSEPKLNLPYSKLCYWVPMRKMEKLQSAHMSSTTWKWRMRWRKKVNAFTQQKIGEKKNSKWKSAWTHFIFSCAEFLRCKDFSLVRIQIHSHVRSYTLNMYLFYSEFTSNWITWPCLYSHSVREYILSRRTSIRAIETWKCVAVGKVETLWIYWESF